jgi:ROS/MUCR transcriptional regulator protein
LGPKKNFGHSVFFVCKPTGIHVRAICLALSSIENSAISPLRGEKQELQMKDMKTAVSDTVSEMVKLEIVSNKDGVLRAIRGLSSDKFNPGSLSLLCVMMHKGIVTSLDEALAVGEELASVSTATVVGVYEERAQESVARTQISAPRGAAPLIVPQGAQSEAVAKTMGRTPGGEAHQDASQREKRPATPGRIRYDQNGRVITAQAMGQLPAVPIKESVTPNRLICLEDGVEKQMLKRYLNTQYGMTPQEYIAKWDLPSDYPMTAPAYSLVKSKSAEKLGLGTLERRAAAAQKKAVQANTPEMAE